MQVRQAAEEYRYGVLALSPRTQEWYEGKLKVFVDWCEDQNITLESINTLAVRRFFDVIRKRSNPRTGKPLSSYTVHGYAQVVKGFISWCEQEPDLAPSIGTVRLQRKDMPKVEQKVIETFSEEQFNAMLRAAEKDEYYGQQQRDTAILWLLLDTGMRASELCGLTVENVQLKHNEAYVLVKGKGKKYREIGLGQKCRAALHKYLTRYRQVPDGLTEDERGLAFYSRRGPFTLSGLDQLFQRLGERARIKGVRCSPHTMRHTFAVRYLLAGGDVYVLSRLMGHTTVAVTEKYLKAFKDRQARQVSISVGDGIRSRT